MKTEEGFSIIDFFTDIINFFTTLGKRVTKTLSPEQTALLAADLEVFNKRCQEIADVHYEREERYQKSSDNTCPNCGAKKDEIVNKIRQVQGNGSVDGSFSSGLFYGSGSVHGSMKIDTFGVNHCNACGNEWKKYNKDFKSTRQVAQDGVRYVSRLIQDPDEYKWAKDLAKVFEGCYVETVLKFAEENHYSLYSSDEEVLCFSKLNEYFKSIWDDPNNKKELKPLF